MGIFGTIGKIAKNAAGALPGVGQVLPIALAGLSALQGAKSQGKSNDLLQQALDFRGQDYAGRAPLRQAATEGALRPVTPAPDLSSIFADPGNPYSRIPAPTGAPGLPPPPIRPQTQVPQPGRPDAGPVPRIGGPMLEAALRRRSEPGRLF